MPKEVYYSNLNTLPQQVQENKDNIKKINENIIEIPIVSESDGVITIKIN